MREICEYGGNTLLFHIFNSQEERRKYGGSAFIEIQFCKLQTKATIEKLVAIESIDRWQNDSLYIYIDDDDIFYREYSNIFDCGTYNNLKQGKVDIYGINYYAPFLTDAIIEKIRKDKPKDYEVLTEWLDKSKMYNGFYILGI